MRKGTKTELYLVPINLQLALPTQKLYMCFSTRKHQSTSSINMDRRIVPNLSMLNKQLNKIRIQLKDGSKTITSLVDKRSAKNILKTNLRIDILAFDVLNI